MTTNKLKKMFGENLRKADTGIGYAIIDTWSYEGCTVMGEYPCFPLSAWAECMDDLVDEDISSPRWLGEAVARATAKARERVNRTHFGNQIWGETGFYTVR